MAPMKSDGAKTPPEPPMPMVRLVARILPTSSASSRNQSGSCPRSPCTRPGSRRRTSAAAPAAAGRARSRRPPAGPLRAGPSRSRRQVLDPVQDVVKASPTGGDHGERRRRAGSSQALTSWNAGREAGQERLVAEERGWRPRRRSSTAASRRDRASTANSRKDDLHAEEHAGDRRVERGGDAARGAAGDQDPQPVLRHAHALADGRTPARSRSARSGPRGPPSRRSRCTARRPATLTTLTCQRIRPPLSATAIITSGTPCPRASRAQR